MTRKSRARVAPAAAPDHATANPAHERAAAGPARERAATNLRDRQRQLGQSAVLDAAEKLFQTRGFAQTTIQMIADAAGVGVATVFRHFRSKPGVLAELMRREADIVFVRGMKIIESPGEDPAKTMLALLREMVALADVPASRFEGTQHLALPLPFGHEDTDRMVRWAEAELRRYIAMLLRHYQRTGQLRDDLSIEDLAFIVFAVFNQHYLGISTGDDPSTGDAMRVLRRQIPLLFEPWLVTPGRPAARRTPR